MVQGQYVGVPMEGLCGIKWRVPLYLLPLLPPGDFFFWGGARGRGGGTVLGTLLKGVKLSIEVWSKLSIVFGGLPILILPPPLQKETPQKFN